MSDYSARRVIEDELRRELFGPLEMEVPPGTAVECSEGNIYFEIKDDSYGQFYDAATNQEILTTSTPLSRYGVGVLYPRGAPSGGGTKEGTFSESIAAIEISGLSHADEEPSCPPVEVSGELHYDVADSDDFDLADANKFKPSAMAITFLCHVQESGSFAVRVTGAHYEKIRAHIPGRTKAADWWLRRPFVLVGSVNQDVLLTQSKCLRRVDTVSEGPRSAIAPTTQVFSRPLPGSDESDLRLVTIAVVNETRGQGPESAMFQMGFSVIPADGLVIQAYPEVERLGRHEEEESTDLLYRNKRTYAIGHGCAAEWDHNARGGVVQLRAVAMPAYEVVSLTPNIFLKDHDGRYLLDGEGKRRALTVSMRELANGTAEGHEQVEKLLQLYAEWIDERKAEIVDLPERFHQAAQRHMREADDALDRMKSGWEMVCSNPLAGRAFRWANEAMLYQQVRSNFPLREIQTERGGNRLEGAHPTPDIPQGRGMWRPFQIAFILATLPELVDARNKNRGVVDLIFFPTGGGKTEAYLGACAISILARRLRDPNDSGTDTLMRYTLRLLTAQQFLRASTLICVLEDIRGRYPDLLGNESISIGIWLGGSSTPNTWDQAVKTLDRLQKNAQQENLFLLLKCPWCGAQMGPKPRRRSQKSSQDVFGYEKKEGGTKVGLRCVDSACQYSKGRGLPIHVVDEDIYEVRPSIVIGTVDKFAMLAWRPEARRLFGLDKEGVRISSPPSIILQDELHLISGPLGSMVGLYEPIIHELCVDRRDDHVILPKIIASTATIRRYRDQIRSLYGRQDVALFPPHGLEEGRSFFAEPDIDEDGIPKPGRRYIGVMSASFGSMQTLQTRVSASTLQAAMKLPESVRDGYWTNLNFLNSLRELGNTVSLLQSDVPDYLTRLRRRDRIDPRWPKNTMELTSRRRSDEIPKAIEQLQTAYVTGHKEQRAIDICLASNIIEVGVDIDRLALMTIVGQPKTTAQYIQVSGRVGRRADVSPGLVIVLYGAAKPRDRSHYERFLTYHQQLYAQVEPTSLTPFATPVLRRALHAAVVAYVRQTCREDMEPYPFPEDAYRRAIELICERADAADSHEVKVVERVAAERKREWASWERTGWDANPTPWGDPKQGLMRFSGTLPDLDSKATIWDVPTSMRNVDSECRLEISLAYNRDNAQLKEK